LARRVAEAEDCERADRCCYGDFTVGSRYQI
jgi:hypothetical protein